MLSLVFFLSCFLGLLRQAQGDLVSTDYDSYNKGKLGHRPHLDFLSSDEFAPMLQVNTWDETAISTRGSHIFLRHDGNDTSPLATPLILDARDLSAVYMNRSFENVFGTRVQENWGKRYLTFWAGQKGDGVGDGWGLAYDENYRLAYKVSAQHISSHADLHEFAFTGHGTALVTGVDRVMVHTKEWKAKGWRGPSKLRVLDAIFQEIDLETGEVLFDWRALHHLDPMDSYEKSGSGWDVFHLNSIEKTQAGNYLISIRHTHSIHLIDGKTGDIIWTLGGKRNVFTELEPTFQAQAPLLKFSWQHHPRFVPGTNETEMTFFDNHGKSTSQGQCPPGHCSRGLHLAMDDTASPPTVRLLHEYTHPSQLRAQSQGSVQPLLTAAHEVDAVFVGWGRCPSFTEHKPTGETVMNVQFSPWHSKDIPDALDNYRAYKMDWVATPWWDPAIALKEGGRDQEEARGGGASSLDVYVSWNGATEVREWVVRAGSGTVLARSARTGFETVLTISARFTAGETSLSAEALDKDGTVIGRTATVDLSDYDEGALEWDEQAGAASGHGTAAGSSSSSSSQDEDVMAAAVLNVGTTLALVGGGLMGFAAVVYGAVMAWRRYRVYDRLDEEDDEFDVGEESEDYDEMMFAPEAVMANMGLLGTETWREGDPGDGPHGSWTQSSFVPRSIVPR